MEQSHLSSQIGKRIKLYRKQQKMTLEDLAACINRSKATVSKYECGAIVLDVETLYEIAGALQVPLSCLMEIPEERADNRTISAKEMLPSRLYFYIYRDRGTRETARHFHCHWTAVERNIRTVIQRVWRVNPTLLQKMARYPLTEAPTTRDFLSIITAYIQRMALVK